MSWEGVWGENLEKPASKYGSAVTNPEQEQGLNKLETDRKKNNNNNKKGNTHSTFINQDYKIKLSAQNTVSFTS